MTVTIESETEVPFDFEYEQTAREVIAQAMDSEEFPYEAVSYTHLTLPTIA